VRGSKRSDLELLLRLREVLWRRARKVSFRPSRPIGEAKAVTYRDFGVYQKSALDRIELSSNMRARLRNITITLPEGLARWARLEAAKQETSVSHFLAQILEERMIHQDEYRRAMRRSLATEALSEDRGIISLARAGS